MRSYPKLLQLESGQGKEITLWIVETVAKNNECSNLNDTKNKALWKGFVIYLLIMKYWNIEMI